MSDKTTKPKTRPALIPNNCRNCEYQEGSPYPESEYSCRGCKNSFDPAMYDAGCKLPNGFDPRPRSW